MYVNIAKMNSVRLAVRFGMDLQIILCALLSQLIKLESFLTYFKKHMHTASYWVVHNFW